MTVYSFYYIFISQVLFIGNFNFNFSSQYVLLGLTSCNTSNIVYYTAILCHKVVLLVLVRLIAIKIFNRSTALILIRDMQVLVSLKWLIWYQISETCERDFCFSFPQVSLVFGRTFTVVCVCSALYRTKNSLLCFCRHSCHCHLPSVYLRHCQ